MDIFCDKEEIVVPLARQFCVNGVLEKFAELFPDSSIVTPQATQFKKEINTMAKGKKEIKITGGLGENP